MLSSIWLCQSTWLMKLISWLGRRRFWHLLNLSVISVCQKKLMIQSRFFTKMMNIHSWCQHQKIVSVLQEKFINKSFFYCVTWRSYVSHTRRLFPNTRSGCQSFVNSDLICVLVSPYSFDMCFAVHQNTKLLPIFAMPLTRALRNLKGIPRKSRINNGSRWRTRKWTQGWKREDFM